MRSLRQQTIEIAKFINQLRRRLQPYAFGAWNIIRTVAGERLNINHLIWRHTEIIDDFRLRDKTLLTRAFGASRTRGWIIHGDTRANELH